MVTLSTLLWQSAIFAAAVFVLARLLANRPSFRLGFVLLTDALAVLFLSAGLTVVLISVFMRYVLNNPPGWADEFARIFVAWGAMFGFTVALREGRHITVDILFSLLGPEGKRRLDLLAHLIGLLFSSFVAVAGWHYVMFLKQLGLRSIYTDIPEWILTFVLPVGFAFFAFQFGLGFWDLYSGRTRVHEEVTGV